MTERISDYDLQARAEDIAREAFDASPCDHDAARDYLAETCEGLDWVIYHHKALQICADCRVDSGEEWLADVGVAPGSTIGQIASTVVYGEVLERASIALDGLFRAAELGDDWASHEAPRNENGWTA